MTAFIVSKSLTQVFGYVEDASNATKLANGNLIVFSAECLHAFSIDALKSLFSLASDDENMKNSLSALTIEQASEIVFNALTAATPDKFIKLEEQAKNKTKEAKPRKVRDSKLQRMATAFRMTNEDGSPKSWSLEELVNHSGVSKRIASVYISILRSPTDRFKMSIAKTSVDNVDRYTYQAKPAAL